MSIELKRTTPFELIKDYKFTQTIKRLFVNDPEIVDFKFISPKEYQSNIENCYFTRLRVSTSDRISLKISNCIIEELYLDKDASFFHNIEILNCDIGKIFGDKCTKILIVGSKLTEDLQLPSKINRQHQEKEINLSKSIEQVEIDDFTCNRICITSNENNRNCRIILNDINTFEEIKIGAAYSVFLSNAQTKHFNLLQNGNQDIQIVNNSNIDKVTINGSVTSFLLTESKIDEIDIHSFVESIYVSGGIINRIYEGGNKNNFGSLVRTFKVVSLRNRVSRIENYILTGSLSNSEHTIKDSEIDQFVIDGIKPKKSEFHFDNVKIGRLLITNSEIEDFSFFRLDFSKQQSIVIKKSLITSAKFHAVQWSSNYQINEDINEYKEFSKSEYLWNIREVYRQLKVISLEVHNKIDANRFLQNEIRFFWKQTTIRDFQNWFILATNWLFSNFGESWFVPLLWLGGVHGLFCLSIMDSFGLEFSISRPVDWEATLNGLEVFFKTISPVHSSDIQVSFIKDPVRIGGIKDFFMRIFSSYFIFYFIRATRKFHFSV